MNDEKLIREEIKKFYSEYPETTLTAFEIAEKFNFKPYLSRSERGHIVRDIKRTVVTSSKWLAKSKWEVQRKGGEIATLQSWKASETTTLENWDKFKDSIITELKSLTPEFLKDISLTKGEYLAELNIPDYHFGKADGRTIDQQCEDYLNAVKILVNKIKGFPVDRYLLVIGNDMFNVDGANNSTTKGTIVDRNCEWDEMYSKGLAAVIKSITYLATIGKVDVVNVEGNHDTTLSFCAAEAVKHYFSGIRHIEVFNAVGKSRKYYEYGKCLIAYTHGEKEKPQDMPLIMAIEEPEAFARCPYRYVKLGHLHHAILKEYQGVEVETLSSLSNADKWHKRNGYLSKPKAQVSIYNKNTGKEGVFIFNNY